MHILLVGFNASKAPRKRSQVQMTRLTHTFIARLFAIIGSDALPVNAWHAATHCKTDRVAAPFRSTWPGLTFQNTVLNKAMCHGGLPYSSETVNGLEDGERSRA